MFGRRNVLMTLYAGAVLAGSGLIVNAGDLNPPAGPVGPTMVTLDEIDVKLDQILVDLGVGASNAARGGATQDRIFMVSDEFQGGSTDATHVDWVELTSATISVDGPDLAPNGPPGPARMLGAIVVSGQVDRALTQIMTEQTSSGQLDNFEIEWCRATTIGPVPFLRITMDECYVTNTEIALDGSSLVPGFTTSITPSELVTMQYMQLDANGNTIATFTRSVNVRTGVVQ